MNKGGKINLSGKALADFRADVSIKLPSKFVENVRMTTSGTIKDEYFGPKYSSFIDRKSTRLNSSH